MTAANQFQVKPDEIRAHASTVGDVACQLSSVAGSQSGGLSDNALGSFVQFLTAGLQDAMNRTTRSISGAASGVDNVRAGLVQTADSYQGIDEHNAAALTAIRPSGQEETR